MGSSSETCPFLRLLSFGFWSWLRLGCVLSGWGAVIVWVFSLDAGLRTLAGGALAPHVDARSCLRNFARLFWNHTWRNAKKRLFHFLCLIFTLQIKTNFFLTCVIVTLMYCLFVSYSVYEYAPYKCLVCCPHAHVVT